MQSLARVLLRCSGVGVSLLLALMLVADFPCFAAEAGSGAYWPGFRNYLAGIVPPRPGFYFRNDVVVYSATAPRVVLNGLPVENISVDIDAEIIEPSYVFPWKLFGATHAFVVTQPLARARLSGQIIGTDIKPSGDRFAPGDIAISPLFLGWNKGRLHYNTNLAIFIPTGDYNISRAVNISRNFWALDPEFGFTYFNPRTGWDLSGALGYSINFTNSATDYRSGEILHLDYAAGKEFRNGLKPGVVGYAVVQTTGDSGSGAIFGPFKSRVYGIGPALEWSAGENSRLMFRFIHEFDAVDHVEGDQFALTLRTAF